MKKQYLITVEKHLSQDETSPVVETETLAVEAPDEWKARTRAMAFTKLSFSGNFASYRVETHQTGRGRS
jgi:hypothetical protein